MSIEPELYCTRNAYMNRHGVAQCQTCLKIEQLPTTNTQAALAAFREFIKTHSHSKDSE